MNPISSILRQSTKNPNEPFRVLTAPTHEAFETNLCKSNTLFYGLNHEDFKTWNPKYRPLPSNYIPIDSLPEGVDFDLVLSQNKFGQYQVLAGIAKQYHLPLISLEHTLPVPYWNQEIRNSRKNMRGDLNVFISDFSIREWGFSELDPTVRVVKHGIDTERFKPDKSKEKEVVIFSCVNDWVNRDWCKLAGQKILTKNGYVPIEKIIVGDEVLTDSGEYQLVTKLFERNYFGDIIKLFIDDVKNPICFTPEHHIRVYRDGQEKYIESNRLRIGDELKFPKMIQTSFECSDSDLAWLIGTIIGDGSISNNGNISICFNLNEKERMDKCKKIMSEFIIGTSISERHRKTGKNIFTVEGTSRIFGNWLKSRIGEYSKVKCIPEFIINGSDKVRLSCLQGLWGCDGSFKNGNRGTRFVYSTTSVKLAGQVSSLLHNFGVKCSINKEKRTTNKSNGKIVPIYRVVSYEKNNVNRCFELIENSQINNPYSYTIKDVVIEEYNGKVYNCSVENDPSYVCYPGFVAHNCCGYKIWESIITDGEHLPYRVMGDTPGLSLPAKSTDELIDAYQTSRVFLNTSTVSPIPTVLLEAMSSGVACVSTATCMIPEVIEHGVNGLMSNDPKKLREYCELLLKDNEYVEFLGNNARKTIVEKFNANRFAQDWNDLFLEASQVIFRE